MEKGGEIMSFVRLDFTCSGIGAIIGVPVMDGRDCCIVDGEKI